MRFQFSWALQISSPSRQYLDAAWPVSIASNCRLSGNELTPSDRQVDLDFSKARQKSHVVVCKERRIGLRLPVPTMCALLHSSNAQKMK